MCCEPDASPPPGRRWSLDIRLHHPNNRVDALAALLRACAASASLSSVRQAHARVLRAGLHSNNSLAATLLALYANLSPSHLPALRVFSSVHAPALSLFNRAIRAFSTTPSAAPCALRLYLHMTRRRISPDNFTIPFLLNSCAAVSDLAAGAEVHSRAMKTGYMGFLPVPNALIDMYGKCGALRCARGLFDEMPARDVVSYNALLGAHAKMGEEMGSARRVFDSMPERNAISWNAMIVGYINGGDLNSARACFNAMPVRNVVSWTTMLVGYTRNSLVDEARLIFDSMPERNLVSWTAMITGYAQNSRPGEALSLFHAMERAGVNPDAVTMTGVISAVAQLGSVDLANWVGTYVERSGIDMNQHVLTALADMHAKCGNADEACRCFQQMPSPDSVSYSALINGLASHGHGLKALDFFARMRAEGVEPDGITFIGVLNACSHMGLVDEGLNFWNQMVGHYVIEPGSDHYACMVDMLGRAGRLKEARDLVESMPMKPCAGALGALLSACRTYDNAEVAETVAARLFELEPENTGNYLLLWSIYAARQQWDNAARVRKAMAERGIKKLPGFSWN